MASGNVTYNTFARHDLVTIDPAVRAVLTAEVFNQDMWPLDQVECLVYSGYDGVFVPGIVTRQPEGVEGLHVGFSAPYRKDGVRLRAAAIISPQDVVAVSHPYEVASRISYEHQNSRVFDTLREALVAAGSRELECGVFGSCALALETGLPYFHDTSDLDLVVRLASKEQLEGFYKDVCAIGQRCGVSTDVEVELPEGWGIKLAELFDDGATVLAKGFSDVRLFPKEDVYAMNHRFPSGRKENKNGSQV